jgi:lipoprotein-anchoring transpeptidase ErfK/SrfK
MKLTTTRLAAVLGALAVLVATTGLVPRALADPDLDASVPGDPLPAPLIALQVPFGTPAGQDPTPFIGIAPFSEPYIQPDDGATVGVAMPITIDFDEPVADPMAAEQSIHISSDPPVAGKFYWMNGSQVRWRPLDFWPAHTTVVVDAGGTRSTFSTGDALVATADNDTHMMTIIRNGEVQQTFPISMGKPGHDTPNGTHYVQGKSADVVMDSETYGVPNTSPEGYRLHVALAVRFDDSGNYVHSAPWSVADQGHQNVSHGCINISPTDAQWFYDNFGVGDPVVVINSVGSAGQDDHTQDWQI